MKKIEIAALALILITAGLLRFPLVLQGFFAYTFDQGRDLLTVSEIVNDFNLTLIGPTTGIMGIFYGPWWYYFLSPIFLITGGNPTAITGVFAAIGVLTIFLLYLLVKKVTGNIPVSLTVAAISAMSQPFITSSSQIWSPSLVLSLMIIYLYALYRIFQNPQPIWFLVLGLSSGFIADSGAAFGTVLILATIVASTFFKKSFFQKSYFLFFAGIFIVLLPRIIFDLRNEFLITKSILAWLSEPKVYQEKLSIAQRLINRLDLFWLQFAQTFTQSKKALSLIPLSIAVVFAIAAFKKLGKIKLFQFLILLVIFIYISFTLYPDAVWDYYLVGLPMILLVSIAQVFSQIDKKKFYLLLPVIILFIAANFNEKLTSPFSITWQGDGAIFRNQAAVLDKIKVELKGDYSLHVYTPARFDYPFDYLIQLYYKYGKIDLPKDNQERLYLIIRDDPGHTYLASGWYGDVTKEKMEKVFKEEFPGSLIVEEFRVK